MKHDAGDAVLLGRRLGRDALGDLQLHRHHGGLHGFVGVREGKQHLRRGREKGEGGGGRARMTVAGEGRA